MSQDQSLPPELAAFEARLAALNPRPATAARDELMYRAGWAACEAARTPDPMPVSLVTPQERFAWGWPLATGALALALIAVSLLHFTSFPAQEIVVRPVTPPDHPLAVAPVEPGVAAPPSEYLQLRELVLHRGLDGLSQPTPAADGGPSPEATDYRQMRRELLGT